MILSSENKVFRGIARQLNWVVQGTRRDIAFDMIDLSTKFKHVTFSDFAEDLKSIRKLKQTSGKVSFPALSDKPSEWTIIMFSFVTHANLNDGVSSMGARIIVLVNSHHIYIYIYIYIYHKTLYSLFLFLLRYYRFDFVYDSFHTALI